MNYITVREAAIRLQMKQSKVRKYCKLYLEPRGLAWKPFKGRDWRIAEAACAPWGKGVCSACGKPL